MDDVHIDAGANFETTPRLVAGSICADIRGRTLVMEDRWNTSWDIDADDRIVRADGSFTQLLPANRPGDLTDVPAGRPIWEFIARPEVSLLLVTLLRRVRNDGRMVELPYRPDPKTPDRLVLLRLVPLDNDGAVRFYAKPYAGPAQPEPIPAVNETPLRVCSWCNKVHTPAGWLPAEQAAEQMHLLDREDLPGVSHGLCDACIANILQNLPKTQAI